MAHRRLFFALWPDADTRAAIVARRGGLPDDCGRPVPDYNLHVTLVFLGDCPDEHLGAIREAAGAIRIPAFGLRLDRFGCFPAARVLWLGGEAPASAGELVRSLTGAMQSIVPDLGRRPWQPHVTLYRKSSRRNADLPRPEPVDWSVSGFALVESIPGRPYQVLRTWPLIMAPDAA